MPLSFSFISLSKYSFRRAAQSNGGERSLLVSASEVPEQPHADHVKLLLGKLFIGRWDM